MKTVGEVCFWLAVVVVIFRWSLMLTLRIRDKKATEETFEPHAGKTLGL